MFRVCLCPNPEGESDSLDCDVARVAWESRAPAWLVSITDHLADGCDAERTRTALEWASNDVVHARASQGCRSHQEWGGAFETEIDFHNAIIFGTHQVQSVSAGDC